VTDRTPHSGTEPESDARPLRELRAERLLSLRDLARLAGVALSTVYLIETGRSTPRRAAITRLSAALDIDPLAVAEFRRALRARADRG
jgi:transcriptional regulator with XRE-family HTH domain